MNRDLRLLCFSLFLWGIGEGMFLYIQPIYLTQLGANALQVGGILGLAGAAMAIAHIPAGAIADHVGRKAVMTASWVMGLVAAWMMFLARSLPSFVLALVLYSLTAFVISPMTSYVTVARGNWSVGRALTTISAFFNAGAVIGPVAGGLLAGATELRNVYGAAAGLFIFSTVLMFLVRHQPVEPAGDGHRYRALFRNHAFGRLLVLVLVSVTAMYLSWPLTPVFLEQVRSLTVTQVGALGSANALGVVFLSLTLGRTRPRAGFFVSQVLVWISVLVLWQGAAWGWFAAGYFLAGGFRTARSLLSAMIEGVIPRSQLGLAYGVAETVAGLSLVLAPVAAGFLYDVRPETPYLAAAILIPVGIVISAALAPTGRIGVPAQA
ncbi:MAG TPA: MFS transporter [Anaerolineales bacterium]|nr:MFS transporter [Anaerolineales bacterium]